jgi:hypothetical protein
MALECANCGSTENVDAVCHHCGKPLCGDLENCRCEIEDSAFGSTPVSPVVAFHCRECWQVHHPGTRPRRPGAVT